MSIKIRKNRNYRQLIPRIEKLFEKFGYRRLEEYAKPYYINCNEGCVYRVVSPNQLKQMRDGAKQKEYGYLKLKCKDGITEDVSTHKLVIKESDVIQNRKNKGRGHHIDCNAAHNGQANLLPVTDKEHHEAHRIYKHERDKYSEFIEKIRKDNSEND